MSSAQCWWTGRTNRMEFPKNCSFVTLLVIFAYILHGATALILENGNYVLCGSSAEEIALHATNNIAGGVNTLHQLERTPCETLTREQLRFRTYDGTCNARNDLGAAFSVVKRYSPAFYQGDNSGPRRWARSGASLPSARVVSRSVHQPKATRTRFTLIVMQLGQFLDHDLDLVPVATESDDTIRCCGLPEDQRYFDCFPIWIPADDHAFHDCMEFIRSDAVTYSNGTVLEPRIHLNAITAFVDASNIYGSDRERVRALRTLNGTGALLKTKVYKGAARLPKGHDHDCVNEEHSHFCSLAGDDRVNEQPGLTAIHTVFHLEHNRLVRKLVTAVLFRTGKPFSQEHVELYLATAPLSDQEKIFQVVRKVLGGIWQKIVYEEYIPLIIGRRLTNLYGLSSNRRVAHDPDVDPSIAMEFLSAAFRFGHTLVNDLMFTDKLHSLRELFGTSKHNLEHFPKIIKGMVSGENSAESYDASIVSSLTDHLFANTHDNMGLDLAALNIQRGRDHAIPTYNEMRAQLGLEVAEEWEDFGEDCEDLLEAVYEMMSQHIGKPFTLHYINQALHRRVIPNRCLKAHTRSLRIGEVLKHPDDVELFTGGTCEESVEDGIVGEIFGHILARQFHDLKFGDRYFYQTEDPFFGFTNDELDSLRKIGLSKVLCENAGLGWIQSDPFRHPHDYYNPLYPCSSFLDIDMWFWATYLIK